jgi:hypothetical protein
MSDVKLDEPCIDCKHNHGQLIELLLEAMGYVEDAEFDEGLSVYGKDKAKKLAKKIFKILELHGCGRLHK